MTSATDSTQPLSEERTETLTVGPAEGLAGLLDADWALDGSAALPFLWHSVYLLPRPPQRDLGPDGHRAHGFPSPPERDLERMFAGGRVTSLRALEIGTPARRTSAFDHTVEKHGRSGRLIFVTVRSEIRQHGILAVVDEQDLVYRPRAPFPAAGDIKQVGPAGAQEEVTDNASERTACAHTVRDGTREPSRTLATVRLATDPVVLFRFSALTYNAHRIHYDLDHAREAGYPGLVVQGPLQVVLMAEALRRLGQDMTGRVFSYRVLAPAFSPAALVARVWREGEQLRTEVGAAGRVSAVGTVSDAEERMVGE